MKMLCLELLECLSQVVTKFDGVIARSSPNEKENAHSPNVPMFSPKGEVIHEISLKFISRSQYKISHSIVTNLY